MPNGTSTRQPGLDASFRFAEGNEAPPASPKYNPPSARITSGTVTVFVMVSYFVTVGPGTETDTVSTRVVRKVSVRNTVTVSTRGATTSPLASFWTGMRLVDRIVLV